MSLSTYILLHIFGVVCAMMGFGILIAYFALGTNKAPLLRTLGFFTHGLGLAMILVSGFGLLARLGILRDFPYWVYIKLAIWIFFGAIVALVRRRPQVGPYIVPLLLALAILAAYLGLSFAPHAGLP
ncbi:MAG: hypothetical protein C5B49_15360 [Bdellovibrio sp.]|nr:MAG: hypothetical protein C5B49_15360 [Bdellovibrio sp.]